MIIHFIPLSARVELIQRGSALSRHYANFSFTQFPKVLKHSNKARSIQGYLEFIKYDNLTQWVYSYYIKLVPLVNSTSCKNEPGWAFSFDFWFLRATFKISSSQVKAEGWYGNLSPLKRSHFVIKSRQGNASVTHCVKLWILPTGLKQEVAFYTWFFEIFLRFWNSDPDPLDFEIFGIFWRFKYPDPDPRDFGIFGIFQSGFSNPDPNPQDFGIFGIFWSSQK